MSPSPECQPELFDPEHRGLHPHRLTHDPERIYLQRWKKANERKSFVNSGFTLLEWILCPKTRNSPLPVSQRDACVAAAVIQWLGTNCGMGFLREAEREIEAVSSRRLKWGALGGYHLPHSHKKTAELIAAPFSNAHGHGDLVRAITAALHEARRRPRFDITRGTERGIILRDNDAEV